MILITRPVSQTKNLELLLSSNNFAYALFPAFEIIKLKTKAPTKKYDVIIFISINAVNYAERHFGELFTDSSKVFAVGPVTANQLFKKNISVDCFPKINASSQELLKMKECSELSDKQILIVRGKGGSETLKKHLNSSNQVDYLEVYERSPCNLTELHRESIESFLKEPDGVLMLTSKESLYNVVRLVNSISSEYFEILRSKKTIVFSQRIKSGAKSMGFENIVITQNPSDEDFVSILLNKK